MIDSTPLSPAAQAVLDAAFGEWMKIDDVDDDIPGKIAAALRALNTQLGHSVLGVRSVDCSQIELIAQELENHQ